MGLIKEFKEFAMRGNVIDMAVGIVIGVAFGKIVSAIVEKIFMPIVGAVTQGVDFSKAGVELKPAVYGPDGIAVVKPAVLLGYGTVIQSLIDFVIVAFCLFLVIKAMNRLMPKPPPPPPPGPTPDQLLLTEIRDLLARRT